MIIFDTEKDKMRYSGNPEDLKNEVICIIKIIQQEFIMRNKNERFIWDIIESLFDDELDSLTKEIMKIVKVKKG